MASTGDVKAGGAYVEISAKDNTKGGFGKVGAALKGLGAGAAAVGAALGVGLVAGAGLLAVIAKKTAAVGDDLRKSAKEMGLTVEEVGAMRGFTVEQTRGAVKMSEAFEQVGTAITDVVVSLGAAGVRWVSQFDELRDTWQGFADAVKANDLEAAVDLAFLRIQKIVLSGTVGIRASWSEMLKGMGVDLSMWTATAAAVMRKIGLGGAAADIVGSGETLILGGTNRDAIVRDTNSRVAELDKQIAGLRGRVKEKLDAQNLERAALGMSIFARENLKVLGGLVPDDSDKKIAEAVRGTFGGAGALRGQLGGGSLAERGVKAQEKVAANTERLIQIALAKGAAFV